MPGSLTAEEAANGWTEETIEDYRTERNAANPLTGGNLVTAWERPRPPIRLESALQSNPHKYWR